MTSTLSFGDSAATTERAAMSSRSCFILFSRRYNTGPLHPRGTDIRRRQGTVRRRCSGRLVTAHVEAASPGLAINVDANRKVTFGRPSRRTVGAESQQAISRAGEFGFGDAQLRSVGDGRRRGDVAEPFEAIAFIAVQHVPVGWAEQVIGDGDVFGQERAAGAADAGVKIEGRPGRLDEGVESNEAVARLEVAVERRIDDARGDPETAFLHALDVIVDDNMVLADDANSAGAALTVAEEEIALNAATVAVAQSEHAGAIAERVEAVNIFAGFVRDDFVLAVALVEKISLHERAGVGHGLMAVTDADGFAAIAAKWRAWAEIIVVNDVVIGPALDFHLQGGMDARFAGEITMVHAIGRATHMD